MSTSSGDSHDLESPGMALVQKLKVVQMSFGQVADMVFKNILFSLEAEANALMWYLMFIWRILSRMLRASAVVYLPSSTKAILPVTKVTQWKKFFPSSSNKVKLISFLGEQFKSEQHRKQLAKKEMYITDNKKCFKLSSVGWYSAPDLYSTQEEADWNFKHHYSFTRNWCICYLSHSFGRNWLQGLLENRSWE